MKTKLTAAILSIGCFFIMSAFVDGTSTGSIRFEKRFGDLNCYEEGYSIIPVDDTYIVTGAYNCTAGPGNWRSWLMQLDANGNIMDDARDVQASGFAVKTLDGNFIAIGGNQVGLNYDTIKIHKADLKGNVFWTTTVFYPLCKNTVTDIYPISDGYLVSGIFSNSSCTNPMYDSFIMKLDLDGNIVWEQVAGGDMNDQLHSIQESPNGDIVAFGFTNSKTEGNGNQYWLLRLTADGQLMYSKTYGSTYQEYGYDLEVTQDDGVLISGYGDSIEVMKITEQGQVEWAKGYGKHCGGSYFKIQSTPDGGFALLASENLNGNCTSALMKIKPDGELFWKKNWNARLRDFAVKEDGAIALTGYADYLPDIIVIVFDSTQLVLETEDVAAVMDNNVNHDITAMLDSLGIDLTVNEEDLEEKYPGVKLYPNPADQFLYIEFNNPEHQKYRLEIYDMNGQLITIKDNIYEDKYLLQRGMVVSGAYTYKLVGEGNTYCGKFMFH